MASSQEKTPEIIGQAPKSISIFDIDFRNVYNPFQVPSLEIVILTATALVLLKVHLKVNIQFRTTSLKL